MHRSSCIICKRNEVYTVLSTIQRQYLNYPHDDNTMYIVSRVVYCLMVKKTITNALITPGLRDATRYYCCGRLMDIYDTVIIMLYIKL